jgi:hypothetical protein
MEIILFNENIIYIENKYFHITEDNKRTSYIFCNINSLEYYYSFFHYDDDKLRNNKDCFYNYVFLENKDLCNHKLYKKIAISVFESKRHYCFYVNHIPNNSIYKLELSVIACLLNKDVFNHSTRTKVRYINRKLLYLVKDEIEKNHKDTHIFTHRTYDNTYYLENKIYI